MEKKLNKLRIRDLNKSNVQISGFENLFTQIELEHVQKKLNTIHQWSARLALERPRISIGKCFRSLTQRRKDLVSQLCKATAERAKIVKEKFHKAKRPLQFPLVTREKVSQITSSAIKVQMLSNIASAASAQTSGDSDGGLTGVASVTDVKFYLVDKNVDYGGGSTLTHDYSAWTNGKAFFSLVLNDKDAWYRFDKSDNVGLLIEYRFDLPSVSQFPHVSYEWCATLDFGSYFGRFAEDAGKAWAYVGVATEWEGAFSLPDDERVIDFPKDAVLLVDADDTGQYDISVNLSDYGWIVENGKAPTVWVGVAIGLSALDGENFYNGTVEFYDPWPVNYPYVAPLRKIRYVQTPIYVGGTELDPSTGRPA